jgi:predicted RNase H-like HicB family nuclease
LALRRNPEQYSQADRFEEKGRINMAVRYGVVIEKAERNYAAYVPDLPGCVATGRTVEQTERRIREAIRFHLEGLKEEGEPIPEPSAVVAYVEA